MSGLAEPRLDPQFPDEPARRLRGSEQLLATLANCGPAAAAALGVLALYPVDIGPRDSQD